MVLPGGTTVRYQCVGCEGKISHNEHLRNLTTEKLSVGGVEHTMTVILCDKCKPKYDAIVAGVEGGDNNNAAG